MGDVLGLLSRIHILEVLPEEGLAEVEHRASLTTAPKGTVLMSPNRATEAIYLLKQGRVRLYQLSAEGKQFTTHLLGPGDIFGQAGPLSTATPNTYAETLDDSLLCVLRWEDLEALSRKYPQLAVRLIEALSLRLRQLEELAGRLVLADVRTRLVYLLLQLGERPAAKEENGWVLLNADLTHQDLATMVGATRESVSQTLSLMARDGLVRSGRKVLWINPGAMRKELDASAAGVARRESRRAAVHREPLGGVRE